MHIKFKRSNLNSYLLLIIWIFIVIFKLQTNSTKYWSFFWLLVFGVSGVLNGTKIDLLKKNNAATKYIYFFIIWSLISTFINLILGTNSNYSYSVLLFDNFVQMLLPLVCLDQIGKKASAICFLNCFKILIVAMSLWGVADYVTRSQLYAPLIKTEQALHNMNHFFNAVKSSYRLTLIFYHPIYYALLLTICMSILIFFPFKNKAIQLISLCLVGLNIILTQTRSAWICVAIVVLLFVYRSRRSNPILRKFVSKTKLQYAILTCVIIGFLIIITMRTSSAFYSEIVVLISDRINALFLGDGTDIRLANFIMVGNIILNNPHLLITGGGLMYASSYLQNHPALGYWTKAVDNQYLTNVINYGLIGLGIYLMLLAMFVRGFKKDYNAISSCLNLSLITIMISSFVFESVGSNIIFYLFIILISLSATAEVG